MPPGLSEKPRGAKKDPGILYWGPEGGGEGKVMGKLLLAFQRTSECGGHAFKVRSWYFLVLDYAWIGSCSELLCIIGIEDLASGSARSPPSLGIVTGYSCGVPRVRCVTGSQTRQASNGRCSEVPEASEVQWHCQCQWSRRVHAVHAGGFVVCGRGPGCVSGEIRKGRSVKIMGSRIVLV